MVRMMTGAMAGYHVLCMFLALILPFATVDIRLIHLVLLVSSFSCSPSEFHNTPPLQPLNGCHTWNIPSCTIVRLILLNCQAEQAPV